MGLSHIHKNCNRFHPFLFSTWCWISTPYRVSHPITPPHSGTPSWHFTFRRMTPPTRANHRRPSSYPPSHQSRKKWSKIQYDSHVQPRTFNEGDMVLVYDQPNDKLGKGKFDSMWYGPYVVHRCLEKGAYILVDSDWQLLENPHNGLYLKRFYA